MQKDIKVDSNILAYNHGNEFGQIALGYYFLGDNFPLLLVDELTDNKAVFVVGYSVPKNPINPKILSLKELDALWISFLLTNKFQN